MSLQSILNKLPQTIYCERGFSAGFWAEPINALTNLAFPIVGYLSYKLLKANNIKSNGLLVLPWLLGTVGVGSFFYHTNRNSITLLADSIPIYTFILFTLFLTLKELFQSKIKAVVILTTFVLVEVLLSMNVPKDFMNGSIRHITAILFIYAIGWLLNRKYGAKIVPPLVGVVGSYAIAIFFRTADRLVCDIFPVGTHFLWHILTAIAGYFGIMLLVKMKKK